MLYSREFLERVKGRLAPGGLYVQWAPTRRAVETFAAAFPHALLLKPGNIMLGSEQPILNAQRILLQRLADPAAVRHFARGNPTAGDLGALIAAQPEAWGPGDHRPSASLTDMFPRDEFFLSNRSR